MHDVAIGLENRPGPWPRWVALWATSCDRPFEVVLIARKKVIVSISCGNEPGQARVAPEGKSRRERQFTWQGLEGHLTKISRRCRLQQLYSHYLHFRSCPTVEEDLVLHARRIPN